MAIILGGNNDTEAKIADGLWLTQAGKLALATPCGTKDLISNNRRDKDGRDYLLTGKLDDTAISVQLVAKTAADISKFTSEIDENGYITLKGVKCIYKNVGSISSQDGYVLFNANLIKLAVQPTQQ